MKQLKKFGEFVEAGVVKACAPDARRAGSLLAEAQHRRQFLDEVRVKVGLSDDNANYFVEMAYDVIIELLRAKMVAKGMYASGEGAHEAEVLLMLELGFSYRDTEFMDELRYFRNGILYYGKRFDAGYGEKVLDFLRQVYPRLTDGKTTE